MHVLMIYVEGLANPMGFLFEDREKAQGIFDTIRRSTNHTDVFDLSDDFGRQASIRSSLVKLVQLTDFEAETRGQNEVQSIQIAAQQRLQQRAQMMADGPKLVSPRLS